jgi:hypothetical protein
MSSVLIRGFYLQAPSQTSSAQTQDRHEPRHAVEPLEDGADLVACHHHGQKQRPLGPDDDDQPGSTTTSTSR